MKMPTRLRSALLRAWFCIIQFGTIPANYILTRLLRLEIHRPDHLKITSGTLIIANHQSKIDPFLISYHIGIQNWTTIVPIRYPVTPDYMQRKMLGFFIRLFGGYTIGENTLERLKQLVFTRELLRQKYTVVLFPEGKIVRDSEMVAEFKRGAHALFTENYPVVFVRLTGLNTQHVFRFWKNKKAYLEYSQYYGVESTMTEKIDAMVSFFSMTPTK